MFSNKSKYIITLASAILLVGLLAGCSSSKLASNTGGFTISVLDSNNQPLIGANIVSFVQPNNQPIVSFATSTETNPVNIQGLIPGQYSWKVSKTGYTDTIVNINIVPGQSIGLSVTLNLVPAVTTQ